MKDVFTDERDFLVSSSIIKKTLNRAMKNYPRKRPSPVHYHSTNNGLDRTGLILSWN